jgi:hypothetical protein
MVYNFVNELIAFEQFAYNKPIRKFRLHIINQMITPINTRMCPQLRAIFLAIVFNKYCSF